MAGLEMRSLLPSTFTRGLAGVEGGANAPEVTDLLRLAGVLRLGFFFFFSGGERSSSKSGHILFVRMCPGMPHAPHVRAELAVLLVGVEEVSPSIMAFLRARCFSAFFLRRRSFSWRRRFSRLILFLSSSLWTETVALMAEDLVCFMSVTIFSTSRTSLITNVFLVQVPSPFGTVTTFFTHFSFQLGVNHCSGPAIFWSPGVGAADCPPPVPPSPPPSPGVAGVTGVIAGMLSSPSPPGVPGVAGVAGVAGAAPGVVAEPWPSRWAMRSFEYSSTSLSSSSSSDSSEEKSTSVEAMTRSCWSKMRCLCSLYSSCAWWKEYRDPRAYLVSARSSAPLTAASLLFLRTMAIRFHLGSLLMTASDTPNLRRTMRAFSRESLRRSAAVPVTDILGMLTVRFFCFFCCSFCGIFT
mmetsp:Transcript_19806/g.75934  ORF Transcript_19806/g.75934 Transcript_19806/m.75934 type:complete len:410 (+) Transcript_19806:844-2073(+)